MGNRPSSTIIYGFAYKHDWESDSDEPDADYEKKEAWEALNGLSDLPYAEQKKARKQLGMPVCWDYMDEPNLAFGIVLAHGDWDDAEELGSLDVPKDADEKIAAVCKFYGVEAQPAKLLMLSSYG